MLTQSRFRSRRLYTGGTTMPTIHLSMPASMIPHMVSATLKM